MQQLCYSLPVRDAVTSLSWGLRPPLWVVQAQPWEEGREGGAREEMKPGGGGGREPLHEAAGADPKLHTDQGLQPGPPGPGRKNPPGGCTIAAAQPPAPAGTGHAGHRPPRHAPFTLLQPGPAPWGSAQDTPHAQRRSLPDPAPGSAPTARPNRNLRPAPPAAGAACATAAGPAPRPTMRLLHY